MDPPYKSRLLCLRLFPGGPRKYRYHSPVISSEWCAFTNYPWGRGPINFAPEEEERALETCRTWARLLELLPVSGKPDQYDDLRVFVDEQELFRELVAQSRLPSIELDVSDNNIACACDRIADWLEKTGGLHMYDP